MKLLLGFCLLWVSLFASPKYYLSICAIFRNEARFLKEWIEYHRYIGVEHFYLFNHLSEDEYKQVLNPYIRQGIVELFEWPYEALEHKQWVKIQCAAYNTLLASRKEETFWLAIIDSDEFIVLVTEKNLKEFLKSFEKYGGIGINWQNYGISEFERLEEGKTLIGSLVKKAPTQFERNRFVKTICQPTKIKTVKKPHHCIYKKGYYHVNENRIPFPENRSLTDFVSVNKIRINHYTYRDKEFFYFEKQRRFSHWFPLSPPTLPNPIFNEVEDPILVPISKEIEKKL